MNYLIGILCAAMIVAIFLVYIVYRRSNLRTEYKALTEANEKLRKQQEEEIAFTKKLLAQQEEIEKGIGEACRKRNEAQQRAAEAQTATEQVLAAEQRRLTAEIENRKKLGEIDFQQKEKLLKEKYKQLNNELDETYQLHKDIIDDEIKERQQELDKFKAISEAVNQAILRKKELEEKENFYSLQISQNDKEDIAVLQKMDLDLHNRDVIPKLIWDLFMRRPAQEMVKRVTGGRSISGIYKITNKSTGEAYIGKTTDILTRWQNHIKTAIGLEAAAKSTLHTRLAADGVWNYTFEILEEVPKDQLSAREAFYIDLYGTKKQLNMKEGNKNEFK